MLLNVGCIFSDIRGIMSQYPPPQPGAPQQFQQGPPPPQQFQQPLVPPQAQPQQFQQGAPMPAEQFYRGPPQQPGYYPPQGQAPQQQGPPPPQQLQQAPPPQGFQQQAGQHVPTAPHLQGPPPPQQTSPVQYQQLPPPQLGVPQLQGQQGAPPQGAPQQQQLPPPQQFPAPQPFPQQQFQQEFRPPQQQPQYAPQQQQQQQQQPQYAPQQQQQPQYAPPPQQQQQQQPQYAPPQQYPPQQFPQQQYPQQGGAQYPQPPQFPQQGGSQQPYPQQQQAPQYSQPPQQQPMSLPAEDASVHTVTISKAASTGKVVNNGTIPRLTVEQRESERVQIPLAGVNPMYIKPAKLTSARTTLRVIPSTPQIADQIHLPLGITIRPLGEAGLPLVDFAALGDVPVVRCKRCRGYINPYVTFQDGGRRWQCVMCRGVNEVPPRYFSPLNPHTGLREDLLLRPELCNAAVELVAPAEYMVRPPQRPIFLVLIDVSYNAVQSGMLRAQCEGVLSALEQLKEDDSMYMSVIAYDSTIYLFNLRSTLQAPKMIVAPDLIHDVVAVNENSLLDAVELPALPEDLVVAVRDSMHLLTQLFEKLPGMFAGTKNVDCAFGPALTTSMSLLTPSGGKIIASVSAAPSLGEGKVQPRTDKKLMNQPKEYTMSLPANDWYKQRSLACNQAQISVDLLVNGSTDIDLATLAPISRYTGGHIHRFPAHLMGGLRQQIERMLVRDTAFEAVLRVRAATGLTVPNFFGHCYVRGPDLLALPMTDSDSAYALQLQLTGPLNNAFTYVQIALLYTSRSRERRIRVHTIQLGVSNSIPRIFNSGDAVAMGSFLSKMCVDNSVSCAFGVAQQKINDKVVSALKFFKKQVTNPAKYSSSLALPESLKSLPFLLCGYYRCASTRSISTVETSPDERVASMSLVMTAPVDAFLSYVTSSTFCVYSPREALENLPIQQLPTQDSLKTDGIYLIDTGACRIVWIGNNVDPRVLSEFGLDPLGSSMASDGALTNGVDIVELAHRFSDLSARLEGMSVGAAVAPQIPCRQGAGAIERVVGVCFVDDDVKEAMSLGNYLAFLQRKVATD